MDYWTTDIVLDSSNNQEFTDYEDIIKTSSIYSVEETKNLNVFFNSTGSNPCQNGGSCLPSCHNYTCVCPSGYTGRNCENSENLKSF